MFYDDIGFVCAENKNIILSSIFKTIKKVNMIIFFALLTSYNFYI